MQLRQADASGFHQRLRLTQVQLGADTVVKTQLAELERRHAAVQCLLRDGQRLLVGQQAQVGIGHSRDQADLCRFTTFLGGQIQRQSRVFEAGHAAKEIDLIRRHRQPSGISAGDAVAIGVRLAQAGDAGTDCRKLIGAADLKLGSGLLDGQHRDAQIAVIRQRDLDQLAQLRVTEEALPFER